MLDDAARNRFWANVEQRGPDECWPWKGCAVSKDGRGTFSAGRRRFVAPRLMLMLHTGQDPDKETFACHSCDNPNCVNPNHLWWGDRKDNAQDAVKKGRYKGMEQTHCIHGHPLSGDNLRLRNGRHRSCWTCQRRINNAYGKRKRALARQSRSSLDAQPEQGVE